jgi:hypothetical protein
MLTCADHQEMENSVEQWNAVKPATTCIWIQGQTATESIAIFEVDKKDLLAFYMT